jgi:cytidylate kinase
MCADLVIGFDRSDGSSRVTVNGEDVSAEIRTPEISLLTSRISVHPQVRECLLRQQRALADQGGVIMEGRDIGTVVFPHADAKFFLSASAEQRGARRFRELVEKGEAVTLAQTVAEVRQRDEQDLGRLVAPLCQAADAVAIDSTELTIEQVLERMLAVVRERLAGPSGTGAGRSGGEGEGASWR